MRTITTDCPKANPDLAAASSPSTVQAKVTPTGPPEPPRISLRFDSAAGPMTGVLMDERTGHVQWFMGWLELIRAIEANLPWRDATLSDDAGALSALVARACLSGRSAVR